MTQTHRICAIFFLAFCLRTYRVSRASPSAPARAAEEQYIYCDVCEIPVGTGKVDDVYGPVCGACYAEQYRRFVAATLLFTKAQAELEMCREALNGRE